MRTCFFSASGNPDVRKSGNPNNYPESYQRFRKAIKGYNFRISGIWISGRPDFRMFVLPEVCTQRLGLPKVEFRNTTNPRIRISRFPKSRIAGIPCVYPKIKNLEIQNSGKPEIQQSGFPDVRMSANLEFRKSGFSISGNPDFRISGF